MIKSNLIFDSDKFLIEWHPEGGDDNPPPGYDLAMILFKALIERGATCDNEFDSTMWEHGNWYFRVKLDDINLSFTIQPYDDEKVPHRWWLAVHKTKLGFIKSIFGGEEVFQPPGSIKKLVEKIIIDNTNASEVIWKSNDELKL